MTGLQELIGLDQGISVVLSFAWVILIVLLIKNLPKWIPAVIGATSSMALALDRQSEVTAANTQLMLDDKEIHRVLTVQVENLKAGIDNLDQRLLSNENTGKEDREWHREQRRLLLEVYTQITGKCYEPVYGDYFTQGRLLNNQVRLDHEQKQQDVRLQQYNTEKEKING